VIRRSAVHRILRLYPSAWRNRYGDEVQDLVDELTATGEFSSTKVTLGLIVSALVQRVRSLRLSWKTLVVTGTAVAFVAAAVILVNSSSTGHLPSSSAGETKGTMPPPTKSGGIDLEKVPDFISVTAGGTIVGYAPRNYLIPAPTSPAQNSLVGGVVPVYGPDLKTLLGHMYPGIGWVPLGSSPAAPPCQQVWTSENGTTSTLPCPSTTVAVPNVVGMPTPDGVGSLQSAGLGILVQNGVSASVPSGHIVRTSPAAGVNAYGREVVTVTNSIGPGAS
jgi:hypothetical protein